MNTRRRLLASALAVPVVLAGCKIRTINYFPPANARVRFANLMLGSTGLDVRESETLVWTGIPFEGTTDYIDFVNQETTFKLSFTDTSTDIANVTIALAGEQPYTLFGYGTTDVPTTVIAPDTSSAAGSGNILLRTIDVGLGLPAIDVYVTAPDIPIDENVSPNFANLNAGSATVALRISSGTYRVRATIASSKSVVYDSDAHVFPDATSSDYVFYAIGAASLPQAYLLDVDGAGTRAIIPSTIAAVKFLNAAAQAGPIDAFVDGTKFIEDLPNPGASGYVFSTAASHLVTIEADSTPGAAIVSLQATFVSAREGSVLVYGLPGAVKAVMFIDDNRVPASGFARVRFVNGSSDAAVYDVFANDSKLVSALAAGTASAYTNFSAGTYTITFRNPATGAIALTAADVEFGDTRVVSVCAAGVAGSLASFLSVDR